MLFVLRKSVCPLLTFESNNVMCGRIPGYGFSESPRVPGFGVKATGNLFDRLMKKLGYSHYLAQGGDWYAASGSFALTKSDRLTC